MKIEISIEHFFILQKWLMRRGSVLAVIICVTFLAMYGLCLLVASQGTEYAQGYTEAAFRKVSLGQAKETVIAALGEPLGIVGYQFVYRYLQRGVNYLVDEQSGSVRVTKSRDPEGSDLRNYYESLKSVDAILAELGRPDTILRAQSGQSTDEDTLTLIYSEGNGPVWNYRLVYVNKKTELVVGKHAERRMD